MTIVCVSDSSQLSATEIMSTTNRMVEDQYLRVSQLSDHLFNHNKIHLRKRHKVLQRQDTIKLDMVGTGAESFHTCCIESIFNENDTNGAKTTFLNNNSTITRQY